MKAKKQKMTLRKTFQADEQCSFGKTMENLKKQRY